MAKKHVALPTSQTSKPRLQKDIFIFLVSRGIIWCHYVDLARAEHLNLSGMATVWKSALKKDTCVTFGGLCICEHLQCLSDNHIFRFLFIFFAFNKFVAGIRFHTFQEMIWYFPEGSGWSGGLTESTQHSEHQLSFTDLYENGIECSFLLAWRGLNVLSFFRWKGIFLILTPSPHRLPHRPSNPPPSTALSFPLTLIEVNDVSRGRRQGRRARSLKSHHLAWSATYTTKTWGVLEMCSPSIFLRAACHGQCSWRRQEGQTNTCTSVTALTGEIKGWQDWNLACPPPPRAHVASSALSRD